MWPFDKKACPHADQVVPDVQPGTEGCKNCLSMGDTWVHLRMCLTCGEVGCCDSSKNKHTTAHHAATGHPIYRSMEAGETWKYCYECDEVVGE